MLHKITYGFVVQIYDNDTKEWVSQEFVASNNTEWETPSGKSLDWGEFPDAYLPFEMKQPTEIWKG